MKEFAYLNINDLNLNSSSISVLNTPSEERFLVANNQGLNALIYAPEIDFYVRNYKGDDLASKLEKLYEARAIRYDYSKDINVNAYIGKNICLLFDDEELKRKIKREGYNCVCALKYNFYYGGVGNLAIVVDDVELECDLILSLEKDINPAVICVKDLSHDEILDILKEKTGRISFNKKIEFNNSLCQLDGRRSECCTRCIDVCPSTALSTDENKLLLSDIDCINCAKCVSVCPTNALEFTSFTKDGIYEVSKLYKDEQIVICDDYTSDFDIKNALVFDIDVNLLDELILLHLINISKKAILIKAQISEFLESKIKLVNDILEAICGKKGIYLDENELDLASYEEFYSNENNFRLNKRELFGRKILSMLKDRDCGKVFAKDYAVVNINKDTCTLCSSCVAACNTEALKACSKTNSITFNASLCTNCNYCVKSCAEENTISLISDYIELKKESFIDVDLVSDKLFACLECNKEFATNKSILKIAAMLTPTFANDELKTYSLYCCADCKAKIMMLKQANVFEEDNDFLTQIGTKLKEFLKDK